MVSKTAVIAIVAILAVPIMLGYALNLQEVTETDYKTTDDSVNVTQLLQSGIDYTYTRADTYELNTNILNFFGNKMLPEYELTYSKTSYPMNKTYYTGMHPAWGGPLSDWGYRYFEMDYSGSGGYLVGELRDEDNNIVSTVNRIQSFYFDPDALTINYTRYTYAGQYELSSGIINIPNLNYRFALSDTGGYNSNGFAEYTVSGTTPEYVDFSKGYVIHNTAIQSLYTGEDYTTSVIKFPDYTRTAIITIDLNSITDPNYAYGFGSQCYLEKTTIGSDVSWQIKPRPSITGNIVPVTDLYYDPDSSNNTYQVKIWIEPDGEPSGVPGYQYYTQHYQFRYIGKWPSLIGEANYYQSFDIEAKYYGSSPNFNIINVGGFGDHSPKMRVDTAEYRAMEYQVIADKTYDPAAFKTNPATTINNPFIYGPSFTFGGNTYIVNKGNITMGNHDIPVKGLVLSSVPSPNGGYDNKIGNTVVSTTAGPSSITFNGKWSASIVTTSQEEFEYTKTEWIAGSFAWDGIDQNFLMIGLLTSLGVFIALGIYMRRSRGSIWPILLVCGGAALLFLVML